VKAIYVKEKLNTGEAPRRSDEAGIGKSMY